MKILDLDIDYFMTTVINGVPDGETERLSDLEYGSYVWKKQEVIDFIENNLGLSKENKIKGRIVDGHNKALFFWKELIDAEKLVTPFDVIHVDSHADLGLGYSSWSFILEELLRFPIEQRFENSNHSAIKNKDISIGIGDYLLFVLAYRWISSVTYCANPNGDKNDYLLDTLKYYEEMPIYSTPVNNTIQLVYNDTYERPKYSEPKAIIKRYFDTAISEPEIPFKIIPTIEDVRYKGDFDYIVIAQSPNYTPRKSDYILDILREYIIEI